MTTPIAAIAPALHAQTMPTAMPSAATQPSGFGQMLSTAVERVDAKILEAESMARAFALDDSIPLHQVTYAMEQARLSFELMLQIRNRMIEGYQQLMNMQL